MEATLPNEVLWLILVYFLNEEHERNPNDGEYVLDHNGNRVPNQLHDAATRQGIVMVWKLVCKAFNEMCPSSIKSPMIGLCDSYEELGFVRDLWNPEGDSDKDAMFLSHALQNANPTLAARMPLSLPFWITRQDFSKLIASYEFCDVLQYFEEQVGVDIDYDDLIAHVIRKDKYDVAKWLINRRMEMTNPWEQNALDLDSCLLRAIRCGSANAVKAVDEIRGPFDTNDVGEIVDPMYKTAIAKAAHYGKLNVVKLLHEQLGYEMNKEVVITALQQGHMEVAKYADQVPSSRCTVGDMMSTDNPNWTQEKVDARDPEYLEHYDMSAFEHVTTYTLERAQDKWHRAQQFAGKLTGARASAGPSAERRMEIMREKQRFREAELAKRAAKAQKTER